MHQLSASQLAQQIARGDRHSESAVRACLAQIDRHDAQLQAFITTCPEEAIATAQAADRAIATGETVGALHGVPISIKDVTATAGLRTTYGSALYQDHIPTTDDLCVARLRAAGAIILGKTNTPEFSLGAHCHNPLCGPTANPYDPTRTSGGSSGGAAVAVATGMAYLSHGTDLGGSVRTPASFCGVVGLRPSVGRIPRVPKLLPWETLGTDGVLARTVEDAALMLSVMAGYDARDPVSIAGQWAVPEFSEALCDRLYGKVRLGFSTDLGIAITDPEVRDVFEGAIAHIASLCDIIAPEHPDCAQAPAIFGTLRAGMLHHLHGHRLTKQDHTLSSSVRWNVERGQGLLAHDLLAAEASRGRLYQSFLKYFETYDVLATLSASLPPYPHDLAEILEIDGIALHTIIDYLTITYTISLMGLPALSIPCGRTASGLPVGIQLIGKPHGEADLLQFAYLLQETIHFRHQWPFAAEG